MRYTVIWALVMSLAGGTTWAQSPTPATGQNPLAPWQAYIYEAAVRFDMPRRWIGRVILAESAGQTAKNGRPIISDAGAMGLMQLMPATYEEMRLAYNLGRDPFDPHDNILAGTAYLRMMFDRFGYPGLFAAYNAGPTQYEASLRGMPLPVETRDYLLKTTEQDPPALQIAPLFVSGGEPSKPIEIPPSTALFVRRWTQDAPPNTAEAGPDVSDLVPSP